MSLNLKKISGKCICFFILFFLVCFISYPVKAGVITNSTQKKQLFAVPGGGWSTITVEVHYNENLQRVEVTINLQEDQRRIF